jgi:glucans biosynthesis protein C
MKTPTKTVSSTRRFDIDWLRVLLILTVFIFHSTRFFDLEGWHVKNASTYLGVQVLVVFLSRWMMPAIFVVSGIAVFYALGKRNAGGFLKDRALRLLVPLLVGIFTHVPLQGYLEERSQYNYHGTFWQFYLSRFDGLVAFGGNFNWIGNHLWYIVVLIAFSLLCLPLFLWLRHGSGKAVLTWLGTLLSAKGAIYLLVLPTLLLLVISDPDKSWLLTGDDWGGWSLPSHLVFFLSGFLLASSPGMQDSIRRLRWVSLAIGMVTLIGGLALFITLGDQPFGTPLYTLLISFSGLICWSWMLAIFGLAYNHLNLRTPSLDYMNEAVMPFYIFHQTILLVVGYFVVNWAIPDLLKWIIIAASSFAIIMLLYEFLVRRINFMRVLFGMKPVHKEKAERIAKPAVQVS